MKTLNLDEITEGMAVAKPIEVDGRVMLGAGTILTEKMLKLLKTWGVVKITITDNDIFDTQKTFEIPLSTYEEQIINNTIDRKFRFCNKTSEALAEIKRITIKRETNKFKQAKKK